MLKNSPVDQAGPKIKVKSEVYEGVIKDATPSEEAVCLSLSVLASKLTRLR